MLRAVIKFFLFASLVLLAGQVRLAGRPIGEHFQRLVFRLAVWSGSEIRRSRAYATVCDWTGGWLNNTRPGQRSSDASDNDAPAYEESEHISASDRDSIMRLLQN